MAGTTLIPKRDAERITWSLNFETDSRDFGDELPAFEAG